MVLSHLFNMTEQIIRNSTKIMQLLAKDKIKVEEVSVLGRSTQGVTLMRTNDGGKVVSIELINSENEE